MDTNLITNTQVVDIFHAFSLRGNLTLTTAELEMALCLVDGLEVTRREVRPHSERKGARPVFPTGRST